jgi:hypothetical protein
LKGEAHSHQRSADNHGPGERCIQLREIPGACIYDHGGERQRNDGRFEPHRPYIGVTEDQTHDKENKRYSKHVNVRDANQCRQAHACIDLSNARNIFKAVQIRDMRITAIVAGKASSIDNRLDLRLVFLLVEAAMDP